MHLKIAALSILFFAIPLLAAEAPRTIDFTQVLIAVDGKPIQEPTAPGKEAPPPLTLGDVAVVALDAALEEDRTASGEAKFLRDQIARKIYKKKSVILTVEEITTIKTRIGKAYPAGIVGAAWRLLDPAVLEKQ
jgi:hypothetical protein